jgi:predicted transcriptional regulator
MPRIDSHFRLSEETHQRLERLAKLHDRSKTWIIEYAVRVLAEQSAAPPQSAKPKRKKGGD